MSLKISQYATSVSSLASGDLMDVSKLISTSPDVYSSDKLNYSVLLSEIIADGSILTGIGTTNYISKFSSSGTLANSLLRDDGSNVSINNAIDASYKLYINSDKLVGLGVVNNAVSGGNNFGISGSATNANTGSNIGMFGNALLSSAGTNLGVRGMAASESVTVSTSIVAAGSNVGGFFQGNASSGIAYGLVATADATSNQASATFTGAYIRAYNAGTKYSVRLVDGSEGTGKFLKSITSIGQANWAALAISDITASLGTALQVVRVNAGATALEYATFSASNLGNANLTADAAERSYTLFGNTSSDKLIFQNLAGNDILTLRGNSLLEIGNPTTYGKVDVYMDPGLSNQFSFYRGATPFINISPSNYVQYMFGTGGKSLYLSANEGLLYAIADTGGISLFNSAFGQRGSFTLDGSGATISLQNSVNAQKFYVSANGATGVMDGDFGVGVPYASLNARLEVKGSTSHSGTNTALFKNSSSVTSLKIRDDNYVIQRAINAAIADADLANNEMSAYINEATNFLIFKVKNSAGVVKTASIALI